MKKFHNPRNVTVPLIKNCYFCFPLHVSFSFHFWSINGRFEIAYFSSGATEVCLEFYDARNVTVREGETAIFGCPLEDKCLADSVEWFELDANGDRQPLKDSRVEIFSFDPLLM